MNSGNPDPADAAFRRTLRSWKVDAPLPPRFEEQVWKRISRTEESSAGITPWEALKLWVKQATLKPAFALSYTGILLALGLLGGFWQAHISSEREAKALSTRYVQMVDPYQMPRH